MTKIPVIELGSFLSMFLIQNGFGARYYFCFICIRKSLTDIQKQMLIEHEYVHHAQATRIGKIKYAFNYLFNRKFRLEVETEAYTAIDYNKYGRFNSVNEMNQYIENLY